MTRVRTTHPAMSQDLWRVSSFYEIMKEQLCSLCELQILPPKKNLKLSAVRLTSTWFDCAHHGSLSTSRRLSEFSRGDFLAAAGGEMRSD